METNNLKQIKEKIKGIFPIIKKDYNVKSIQVFGSYVRQEQKKESDLDLLVEFSNEDGLGLLEFINLENFLSEELNIKVDLVMKDSLKETIKPYILKEAVHII